MYFTGYMDYLDFIFRLESFMPKTLVTERGKQSKVHFIIILIT